MLPASSKQRLSNVFLVAYVLGTLGLRFYLEPQLKGNILLSVALGAFALVFLWALVKTKVLTPTLLGLSKEEE